jgi:hypothetical protein
VKVLKKNKWSSTKGAKPGLTSPGRMTGIGSIEGIPETARKKIRCGIVQNHPQFVPIFEDAP